MSKTIRIDDRVYIALDTIREKRETFSEVIERLVKLHTLMTDVGKGLGPSHWTKERPKEEGKHEVSTSH